MIKGYIAFILIFGAAYLVWRTIVKDRNNKK